MATQPDLTAEQRANLATLAAYLRTLPAEYPDFSMDNFTSDNSAIARQPECGTAACAAGHGIHAGVEPLQGESWYDYSCRSFAPDEYNVGSISEWDWCFSGGWSSVDNTAHGAADRIEYMLQNGVPGDAAQQRRGDAPLCYRAQVSA